MTDHPITPPPELVREWVAKNYVDLPIQHVEVHLDDVKICTEAARWGADQELEACCAWIPEQTPWDAGKLRAARRPSPPSLKEQALAALDEEQAEMSIVNYKTIRAVLEQLDD